MIPQGKIHCDAEVIKAKRWYKFRATDLDGLHVIEGSKWASSKEEAVDQITADHGPIFGTLVIDFLP